MLLLLLPPLCSFLQNSSKTKVLPVLLSNVPSSQKLLGQRTNSYMDRLQWQITPHCWGLLVSYPYLQFIAPINIWNKCIDLGIFLKCKEGPFLRPLRSKDNWCGILRLWPWNFVIICERLATKLEKVRQMSVWQTVPKFWFIWLWYLSFCITYKTLVTQVMLQRRPNWTELRLMDSYIQTLCRFQKCMQKVPPPSQWRNFFLTFWEST